MRTDAATRPATPAKDPARAWRIWFDAWEPKAAGAWDAVVRQPWLVEPLAATITAVGRTKAFADSLRRRVVRACGLATREDQDRILFLLQRMESRLFDLEDRIVHGEDER